MVKKFIGTVIAAISAALLIIPGFPGLSANNASAADITAVWPLPSDYTEITTAFDPGRNEEDGSGHNGIDIPAPQGTDIRAVRGGEVVLAEWRDGYGNMIVIHHADIGVYTFYAHTNTIDVVEGDDVSRGETIATVGNTGASYGNHLHFGICDTLINGWPDVTFFDPLTCFEYTDADVPDIPHDVCNCTDDYAGIYRVVDVDDYLNMRSGHGVGFSLVGRIPAGAEVRVTKADGSWAHVEYEGITGYSSMYYLERIELPESGMEIASQTVPPEKHKCGDYFYVKGIITSNLPIKRVWGGVYTTDNVPTDVYCEDTPYTMSYDLSAYFDYLLEFDKLPEGEYIYRIEAEDSEDNKYVLIESGFEAELIHPAGDADLDGELTIADIVTYQSFLLGKSELTRKQYKYTDMNGDGKCNGYDLILLKRAYFGKMA